MEACGDLSCVGGPWRGLKETGESGGGLQTRRRPTGGLEHRRWDLKARSCSWRLHGARAIDDGRFQGRSGDSRAEVAGEDESAAALTSGGSYWNPNLRGGEVRTEEN